MAGQSSRGTPQIDLLCMLLDEAEEPKALTLPLLTEITNGFSDKLKIGSGGFAVVYKGVLEDRAVAVKRLSNTYMYEKEFLREVECLMKVRHKNIVRFLGYCVDIQGNAASNNGEFIIADVQQKLLCFEYLPKGSLSDYIKDASGGLDWRTRYQIIKGVCEGLQYLHEINIVHLDLKPANVLLDEKMRPKITDFGLSRCFKDDQTRWDTIKVGGTLGYLAPEFYSGTITYKFDLYSLGVMITEIITGKKGYQDVDDVVASWSNRSDKSLWEQIRVCTEIGLECSDFNPGKRPKSMMHIVNRLAETESWQVVAAEGVSTELLLSVRPSVLCFPINEGKSSRCPLHLTNTTDEYVVFSYKHGGKLAGASGCGIVPPRATYTVLLEIRSLYDDLEEMEINAIVLHSTTFSREQIRECERMDIPPGVEFHCNNPVEHEVTLRAFCTPPRGMQISPGIQVLRRYHRSGHYVYSLDTVQAKQWIIVGEGHGKVAILDYPSQKLVHLMKVSQQTVTCVKFIARQQWLVVGTINGYIHVYNCETKMRKIVSFRATDMDGLKSLSVHPTQPYLLSPDHCGMKVWDWDKGFECIHNFDKEHSREICQVAFNLNGIIASASKDHLVKVWSLGSPKSNHTLSGHTNIVNCLDFFTCDDQEYLVTGSNDKTAKIWDMRTKICIHTLEAFVSPVTCVVYEPNLQILIIGSEDGCIYYWNTLNSWRLERIIKSPHRNSVEALACLMGRVVIGIDHTAEIMDIDNVNNYQEKYTGDYNWPQLTGDTTCKVAPAGSSSEQPLEIRLLCEDDPCSLHLTNKTDEHVAFCLRGESGECGLPLIRDNNGFLLERMPYGIVPPRSTYNFFLPMVDPKAPEELILQSTISGDWHMFLFADQSECDDLFDQAKVSGNTVHQVSVKGDTASPKLVISPRVKITSTDKTFDQHVLCMDEHPTEPWIITGHWGGKIERWNYYSPSIATDHHNNKPGRLHRTGVSTCIYPETVNCKSREPVRAVKFIARKQWVLAGSGDGVIHVYNSVFGIDEMEKITTFRVPDGHCVTSLTVHSTQLYVVLSNWPHNEMEVWGWDKGWECTQTSGADGDKLNPNRFVSAALHGTELQVRSPDSPKSDHTLPGHSDSVNCLHYFTRDDLQYLITGSDDCTAKIWDLQKKECIHTIPQEAIMSEVLSVTSLLPHFPYLLTGTVHGTVQVWSSTDFRLERTINFGGAGPVLGLACLMRSLRVVVAQGMALSIIEIEQEVEAVASEVNNENYVRPSSEDDPSATEMTPSIIFSAAIPAPASGSARGTSGRGTQQSRWRRRSTRPAGSSPSSRTS